MKTNQSDIAPGNAYRPLLSGLDSLYVAYFLDGLGFDWEELEYQKTRLQQDRRQGFAEIMVGGKPWALQAQGLYPYRYVLRDENFIVRLTERMQPNCYVQFLSKGLWHSRSLDLANGLEEWFERVGTRITMDASAVQRARK